MQLTMLKRQNANLQKQVQEAKAEAKDKSSQLVRAESSLQAKENALSVLDRTWSAMDEKLAVSIARLKDGGAVLEDLAHPRLLQIVAETPPLAPSVKLDEEMARRAERMVQLAEAVTSCLAQRQHEPEADVQRAEALAAQLQAERAGLTQQLELARDLSTQSQSACAEAQQQAADCRAELDKTLKDLHRERVKKPSGAAAPAEEAAATPAAVTPAAASGGASGDADAVSQQLRKAQEEVVALGKTASERLDETVSLKQESIISIILLSLFGCCAPCSSCSSCCHDHDDEYCY